MKKVAGEFHLGHVSGIDFTSQFKVFRDVYLRVFNNFQILSVDGVDIKWDLWNEHFTNHYKQILVYIDNR